MGGDAVRWSLCATFVAAAHALALVALATPDPPADTDAGSPVVMLELSPMSAAPAPTPETPEAETQPDAEPAPAEPVAPEAAPAPAPVPAVAPPAPVPTPDLASAPPSPAPAPILEDKPPPEAEPAPVVSAPPSPPPSAPSVAAAVTADLSTAASAVPGRDEEVSATAIRTWRREMIAQIERHKRFPARGRGRSGVARVAFSIDRDGRLAGARIVQSSGSAELDAAALDLVRSAQPFPPPPSSLGEKELSFVAPVRYLAPTASR